jgi:hypothetical protein
VKSGEAGNGCKVFGWQEVMICFLALAKTADRFSKPLLSTTQPPLYGELINPRLRLNTSARIMIVKDVVRRILSAHLCRGTRPSPQFVSFVSKVAGSLARALTIKKERTHRPGEAAL